MTHLAGRDQPPADLPWTATTEVDEPAARRLLAAVGRLEAGARVTRIGSGWDVTAFALDDAHGRECVRFPRRALGDAATRREFAVMQLLAPALDARLGGRVVWSRPLWSATVDTGAGGFRGMFAGFGWVAGGAPLHPGRAGLPLPVVGDLAAFLSALHGIPVEAEIAARLGSPLVAKRAEGELAAITSALATRPADRLTPALERAVRSAAPRALRHPRGSTWVHGDLHALHVLVDPTAARSGVATPGLGIVDFGDVCVDDPAIDLVVVPMLADAAGRERFAEAYAGPLDLTKGSPARARAWVRALHVALASERMARATGHPDYALMASTVLPRLAADGVW